MGGGDLASVRGLSNGKPLSMSATPRSHFGMPAPPQDPHGPSRGDPRDVCTLDRFEGAVERSPFAIQLGASGAHRRPRTIPSPQSLTLRDLTAVDAGQGVMGDVLVRRAGVRGLRIRAGIGVGDTYIYGHRPPPLYPRFDLVYLPLYPRSFSFPPPLGPSLASDIDGDPDRTQGNEGEGIPAPEGPDTKGKKGRKEVHAYVGYRAGIRDNGEGPRRRTGTRAHRAGTSARLVLAIGDPRSPNAAPRGVRTSTLHRRIGSARVRRAAAAQAKLRRGRPTRARGCAPRRSKGELGRRTYRPSGLDRGIEDSPIDPRPPADTL